MFWVEVIAILACMLPVPNPFLEAKCISWSIIGHLVSINSDKVPKKLLAPLRVFQVFLFYFELCALTRENRNTYSLLPHRRH